MVRGPERPVAGELDTRFAEPMTPSFSFDGDVHGFDSAPYEEPVAEPQIDWEQVRADARAIVDAAETQAEAILHDAAARARAIVESANQHAIAVESEAAARGREQGIVDGRQAIRDELSEDVAAMHELVESVRRERHAVIESAEPEIVRLAMTIGERIVHEQISIDPNVVIESVRHALTRLIGREVVTLRVHPADLETIRQHRDAIAASNDVEHLRVVEDQRVDRGGVVIETEAGTIDAKISTQLREARRALTSSDTIAASPSADEPMLHSPAQAS
jgi:flagellar assembly protein FliH